MSVTWLGEAEKAEDGEDEAEATGEWQKCGRQKHVIPLDL